MYTGWLASACARNDTTLQGIAVLSVPGGRPWPLWTKRVDNGAHIDKDDTKPVYMKEYGVNAKRLCSGAPVLAAIVVVLAVFTLSACNGNADPPAANAQWPVWDLQDGDYRGHFDDREHNVSVQVRVRNEEIVDVSLRWAYYRGVDYRAADEDPQAGIYQQHVESLEYLIGARGVAEIVERTVHMEGTPSGPALQAISTEDVDGFTAATIRSGKLGSAVRDAFNRGRYRE